MWQASPLKEFISATLWRMPIFVLNVMMTPIMRVADMFYLRSSGLDAVGGGGGPRRWGCMGARNIYCVMTHLELGHVPVQDGPSLRSQALENVKALVVLNRSCDFLMVNTNASDEPQAPA